MLLSALTINKYKDRSSGTYSGGNKRKLSVDVDGGGPCAAALISTTMAGRCVNNGTRVSYELVKNKQQLKLGVLVSILEGAQAHQVRGRDAGVRALADDSRGSSRSLSAWPSRNSRTSQEVR